MSDPYDAPDVAMSVNPPQPDPGMYPEFGAISPEWFRAWAGRVWWTFATSMPWTPHWYSLDRHSESREEFERAVVFIRRYGVIEPWPPQSRKPRMHVYYADEASASRFWTMGAPLRGDDETRTILINRVPTWAPPSIRPPKDRSRKPDPRPPFDPDHPAPPPRVAPPPPRRDPPRPPPPITPEQLTLGGTPRPCVVCGAEFHAFRCDARYCSGSCRTHAYRLRVARGSA